MKKGRLFARLAVASLAAITLLMVPLRAQAVQSITISPTGIDKTIEPGTALNGTLQVLNQGDTEFDYKVYVAPYSVSGEDYDPSFTPIPGATDVTKWVSLKPTAGHLKKYSSTDVAYTITVPAGTKPGGYYAVIFAETEAKAPSGTSGVTTRKRVGAILYIKVAGDTVEAGKVITWKSNWLQYPPLTALLRLENSGSSHYMAEVRVNVKDIFGNVKYKYEQNRQVLPEKIRRINIIWDKTPNLGLFKVDGTVKILGKDTQLATQYVLVASSGVRRTFLITVLIILALFIIGRIMKKRRRKKAGASQVPPTTQPPQTPSNTPPPVS